MNGSELLANYRNGSEQAFVDLLRHYSGLVYAAAKRRVSSHAVAEEVTQVVFTRLAKKPPVVKTDGELAGWLHRTTIHVAIDAWRAEVRRQNREQQAVLMNAAPADKEDNSWDALAPHLDEALDELQASDRHAVLLRFFEGKSMRDVGISLGVTEDAAKMRVSRAINRLRDRLVQRGATCSVVLLATLLLQHAGGAIPAQALARLAALHLGSESAKSAVGTTLVQLLKSKLVWVCSGVSILVLTFLLTIRPSRATSETIAVEPQADPGAFANSASPSRDTRWARMNRDVLSTQPSSRFILHVRDKQDGRALSGGKIRVAYFYAGGEGERHDALTGLDGNAPIPFPNRPDTSPGANIFVCVEGYVPKCFSVRGNDDRAEHVLELEPAAILSGMVMDENGLPVPGVELKARPDSTIDSHRSGVPNTDFQTCNTITDEAGRWTFPFAPKSYSEIRFTLLCSNYAATETIVPINSPETQNMTLVISRGSVVVGKVTDANGNAVEGATILEFQNFGYRKLTAESDANGSYELRGIEAPAIYGIVAEPAPGMTPAAREEMLRNARRGLRRPKEQKVELVVQAEGFAPQVVKVDLLQPTNQVDFVLNRGAVFRGHIVDENGLPISGAIVRTDMDFDNQVEDRFRWFSHATPDGRFEWNSAPSQTLCFWFEADGYEVVRGTPMLIDGTDHRIVLRRKR